jgi:Kef-type K+ transport system membrane component KefB
MDATQAQTLLAITVILATARLLGALFVRHRQPRICGEMLAGLLVGSALLSPWRRIGGAHHVAVLDTTVVHVIQLLGQVGVTLYMLLVGLAISPVDLRRHARPILAVAVPVIIVAAALTPIGASAFAGRQWQLAGGAAGRLVIAAALLVNGLPVVARILEERDLLGGRFGATVLGASALITALPFMLLAVAEAHVGPLLAAWLSLKSLGTGMLGAFLVGIALSRSTSARVELERTLGEGVRVLLVPVFLAAAGARIDPRVLDLGVLEGAFLFTVLLVAVAVIGGSAMARIPEIGRVDARAITALVNCRGLMLLAIAVQMSDHRLIGPRLLAVFFFGAVTTTLMTGPVLARAARLASREGARPPTWALSESGG